MTFSGILPRIKQCAELYRQIFETHGTDTFQRATIAESLQHDITDSRVREDIHLLAAYGVIKKVDHDTYQLCCHPDEDVDQWQSQIDGQIAEIHNYITNNDTHTHTAIRPMEEPVSRNDDSFRSIFITCEANIQDHTDIVNKLVRQSLVMTDGVVLRSAPTMSTTVQRIADVVSDNASVEKCDTDVVGKSKDELEFRLFLQSD